MAHGVAHSFLRFLRPAARRSCFSLNPVNFVNFGHIVTRGESESCCG